MHVLLINICKRDVCCLSLSMCQKDTQLVQTNQGVFYEKCCQASGQNPKGDCKKLTQAILMPSLLAANGQHRDEFLLLGTTTCEGACLHVVCTCLPVQPNQKAMTVTITRATCKFRHYAFAALLSDCIAFNPQLGCAGCAHHQCRGEEAHPSDISHGLHQGCHPS